MVAQLLTVEFGFCPQLDFIWGVAIHVFSMTLSIHGTSCLVQIYRNSSPISAIVGVVPGVGTT